VDLILRVLNGMGLNRIEGKTNMLDWILDVYIKLLSAAPYHFHTN
jgi:hypothetical protein